MNKIKTFLIHLLGGLTVQESQESDANAWAIGKLSTSMGHLQYAQSLNGMEADEWCKTMYAYLEAQVKLFDQYTDNGRESQTTD